MTEPDPELEIGRHRSVTVLTLNRPAKRNALSIELRHRVADALEAAAGDPDVGAIALTGAGSAFCAGMDTSQFGGDVAHRRLLVESSTRCFQTLANCPLPTTALVNGPALGGGFALALLCDVRVGAPAARFGFPELARGIPPSYATAIAALGSAVAADLCLTGRIVEAIEAQALGIVSRVGELTPVLDELAQAPATATRRVKAQILAHRHGRTVAELLGDEQQALRTALLGRSGTGLRR